MKPGPIGGDRLVKNQQHDQAVYDNQDISEVRHLGQDHRQSPDSLGQILSFKHALAELIPYRTDPTTELSSRYIFQVSFANYFSLLQCYCLSADQG